jgi:predicted secreted protein
MRWLRTTGTIIVTTTITTGIILTLTLTLTLALPRPTIVMIAVSPIIPTFKPFLQPAKVHKRRVGLYGRPTCFLPRSVLLTITGSLYVEVPEISDDDLLFALIRIELRAGSEREAFVVRHGTHRHCSSNPRGIRDVLRQTSRTALENALYDTLPSAWESGCGTALARIDRCRDDDPPNLGRLGL